VLPPPPPVLLILGTDAAGKDYVADFLVRRWQARGHSLEKRAGAFAGAAVDARPSSARKGRWGRFQERVFLTLFPLVRPLTPYLAQKLLPRDQQRFRPADRPLVVVSHTALRLLAFAYGPILPPPPLSPALGQALHALHGSSAFSSRISSRSCAHLGVQVGLRCADAPLPRPLSHRAALPRGSFAWR
jgi:hypothetical protein